MRRWVSPIAMHATVCEYHVTLRLFACFRSGTTGPYLVLAALVQSSPAMAPVPWTKVVLWTLIAYGRPPVLVALLVYFGRSYWEAFVAPWKDSGWTDRGVFIVGSWLVHEVLYVGMNGFFYLCDTYVSAHACSIDV